MTCMSNKICYVDEQSKRTLAFYAFASGRGRVGWARKRIPTSLIRALWPLRQIITGLDNKNVIEARVMQ